MSVYERLFAAGLLEAYDAARASGKLDDVNAVLAKVGLHQDAGGMNISVDERGEAE